MRYQLSCPDWITTETYLDVVYFEQLSGAARNLFQPFFNLFCSFQSFLSNFKAEFTKKRRKINKKTCFCLLLKAGRHVKAAQLPERVPRICLFSVDFLPVQTFFSHFWLISFVYFQTFFSELSREITEKAVKWTKKFKKRLKKGFNQLSGARSTQKLV